MTRAPGTPTMRPPAPWRQLDLILHLIEQIAQQPERLGIGHAVDLGRPVVTLEGLDDFPRWHGERRHVAEALQGRLDLAVDRPPPRARPQPDSRGRQRRPGKAPAGIDLALRRDVDNLKSILTLINVGIVPLMIGVLGLLFALRRPRRPLPKTSA